MANSSVNSAVTPVMSSHVMQALLSMLIVGYGAVIAPQIPQNILQYANNKYVRLVALALIVFAGTHNPIVSVVTAIVLFASLNALRGKSLFEGFIGPNTAVLPGCLGYTVADLLESFNGDQQALLSAMVQAKVPMSIRLTDEYAGLIATYLLSFGIKLKEGSCQL
ncbi:hypothetical protein GGF31_003453 [Allomyces arbusculus]|nr:hypothetical protein GGF31_003453 [Allomyces arbusculus]